MKLSTRSRYGTRIILELARHFGKEPVQVSEIARIQKIPAKYLEQLIRSLKMADLITSVRGSKGGHRLKERPENITSVRGSKGGHRLKERPENITVGQIVRHLEGQSDLVECVSLPKKCQMSDECRVRRVWMDATEAMYEKLDGITIADLICEPKPPDR